MKKNNLENNIGEICEHLGDVSLGSLYDCRKQGALNEICEHQFVFGYGKYCTKYKNQKE